MGDDFDFDAAGDADFEDAGDDTGDEYDFEGDEGESDDDPWSWAKDLDPGSVKKTWTQYTQTRDEVLREKDEAAKVRQELEPFMKLKDEILADPGLVKVIDDYYKNGRPVDREMQDVKSEMQNLKSQIMTERELADVKAWAREQGYPDVEDSKVLKHAIDNNIANLKSAYKDMMFDELQEFKANKLQEGIKRSRSAASPKTGKPVDGKRKFSTKDIYSMSDEDFIKNYDGILKRLSS